MFGCSKISQNLVWRVLAYVTVVVAVLTVGTAALFYWGVRSWNSRAYERANQEVAGQLPAAWRSHHRVVRQVLCNLYAYDVPARIGAGIRPVDALREARDRVVGLLELGYTGIERLFVVKADGSLDYACEFDPLQSRIVVRESVPDSLGRVWIRLAGKNHDDYPRPVAYAVERGDTKYLICFATAYRRRVGYRQFAAVFSLRETMRHVAEKARLRSLQGVILVEQDGTILYHKNPAWVGQHVSRLLEKWRWPLAKDVGKTHRLHTTDGHELLLNWFRVMGTPGPIAVGIYTDLAAFEPALLHTVLWVQIALSVFALVVISVLVAWRLRAVLGTVADLSMEAEKIARGKWGGQVPVRTEDEVGRLAENFNRMSRQLSTLVERVVRERSEKLEQQRINEFRAKLLRTVGHDLNKVLGAIKGPAENLAAGVYGTVPDVAKKALWRLLVGVRLMESMVLDMLAMARIERGELQLNPARFRERDLIADVSEYIEALVERVRTEDIKIEVTDGAGGVPMVADREKLVRALVNLVSNAVDSVRRKRPDEGGIIRLVSYTDRDQLVFEISDNGEGIPSDEVARFAETGRISRQAKSNGLGLGLTIVNAFVRLHGGRVEIESKEGKGTVFRVRIPRETGHAEEAFEIQ